MALTEEMNGAATAVQVMMTERNSISNFALSVRFSPEEESTWMDVEEYSCFLPHVNASNLPSAALLTSTESTRCPLDERFTSTSWRGEFPGDARKRGMVTPRAESHVRSSKHGVHGEGKIASADRTAEHYTSRRKDTVARGRRRALV